MIKYWMKLLTGKEEKLVNRMYHVYRLNNPESLWNQKIKEILYECGFYFIWDNNIQVNPDWIYRSVKQKLKDIYLSNWLQAVNLSSKCYLYRIYKTNISLEKYLIDLPSELRYYLIK